MTGCLICEDTENQGLKTDVIGRWIEAEWLPRHPDQDLLTLRSSHACVNQQVLARFDTSMALPEGYTFAGTEPVACPDVVQVNNFSLSGDLIYRSGAFLYRFSNATTGERVEVVVIAAFYTDAGWQIVCFACMPRSFVPVWAVFSVECDRLNDALEPGSKVIIIGGRSASFTPTVDWDDIVLPAQLKADLMEDVQSFFTKGIEVYRRLKLKPFRKLLLAGVPGTGKTMLCSALAKWALERKYLVIYVSSADEDGPEFWKIERALNIAADSSLPTMILLEELDAYLQEKKEKALVLNVLDGAESSLNHEGSLLIATTNYPEAIDERILKRPGRLDRIYVIPETRSQADVEKMLRQYLGAMWREDHRALAQQLVGYPGAFIREVAVYALTLVAYEDLPELSLDLLERSFGRLREQIEARDSFLIQQASLGYQINELVSNNRHLADPK